LYDIAADPANKIDIFLNEHFLGEEKGIFGGNITLDLLPSLDHRCMRGHIYGHFKVLQEEFVIILLRLVAHFILDGLEEN